MTTSFVVLAVKASGHAITVQFAYEDLAQEYARDCGHPIVKLFASCFDADNMANTYMTPVSLTS
jgi:hypothetical protein